jgi:hypothetical protein
MLYWVIQRVLVRHAPYHLVIPLIVGICVEAVYSLANGTKLSALPQELLEVQRLFLYLGIVLAYVVVIGFLIKKETNIGLIQLDLNTLADKLNGAAGLFAVGTMRFDEWFDPATQVYLSTILHERFRDPQFRYERILLLGSRSTRKDLNSDYVDGYYAKSLIQTHKQFGIPLYFMEWGQLNAILEKLSVKERALIGFCPSWIARIGLNRPFKWMCGRGRVRKVAVGVITASDGAKPFRFSKHDDTVKVQFEDIDEKKAAYLRFVDLIKKEIQDPQTGKVKVENDFTKFY